MRDAVQRIQRQADQRVEEQVAIRTQALQARVDELEGSLQRERSESSRQRKELQQGKEIMRKADQAITDRRVAEEATVAGRRRWAAERADLMERNTKVVEQLQQDMRQNRSRSHAREAHLREACDLAERDAADLRQRLQAAHTELDDCRGQLQLLERDAAPAPVLPAQPPVLPVLPPGSTVRIVVPAHLAAAFGHPAVPPVPALEDCRPPPQCPAAAEDVPRAVEDLQAAAEAIPAAVGFEGLPAAAQSLAAPAEDLDTAPGSSGTGSAATTDGVSWIDEECAQAEAEYDRLTAQFEESDAA